MGSLLDAMFDFSEKLGSLGLEPDEMALFMAVVLVSAGKTYPHVVYAHKHAAVRRHISSHLTPTFPSFFQTAPV